MTVNVDDPNASAYKPVQMVVVDGIVTGPTHCAYPGCISSLANHRGESFCITHVNEWANRCRVVDCRSDLIPNTYACAQHQPLWKKHQYQHSKTYLSGLRQHEEWQPQLRDQHQQQHDDNNEDNDTQKHYFGSSRFYCVETICAPCGAVIAWTLFSKAESPTSILEFLADVYPTPEERPDFICIDKASTDQLCRTFCNPAPADGSQPNLVIVGYNKDGQPYLMCAFNTQACEQLNAWLGGFDSILKRLKLRNFQWFLHAMLYYHTRFVLKKKAGQDNDIDDIDDAEGDDDTL
ncbi:hypothetical protein BJ165DRAFT_1411608 [Panaeolus papilionaceus]|nr:hypothetical protein BJ165DRAFT_1411608 [Panaeolus papilionaceus]